MTRKIAGITVGIIAAVGVFASTAPASASDPGGGGSWDHTWTSTDSTHGATVHVLEHGDIIEVCDTSADGKTAAVDIGWNDTMHESGSFTLMASGADTCTVSTASDHDLPEGLEIEVSVYRYNESIGRQDLYATHFVNDH